jgi:hypothetical protein
MADHLERDDVADGEYQAPAIAEVSTITAHLGGSDPIHSSTTG